MSFKKWCAVVLAVLCGGSKAQQPATYVDPFIGTSNNANTYPGALVPWGMLSINPYTVDKSANPSNTSYQKNAPFISGFSHLSLSGVGCKDLGSILLMPAMGTPTTDVDSIKSGYTNENAKAGYYSANLTKHAVTAEMTTTVRTGISSYTFQKSGKAYILIDLSRSLSNIKGASVIKVSDTEAQGFKTDGDFCGSGSRQKIYFVVQLLKKNSKLVLWGDDKAVKEKNSYGGDNVGCWFVFNAAVNEKVMVKIGISYVSIANAKANLVAELPGWDFNAVKQSAFNFWNKELAKITVKEPSADKKTIFYTGLYHALIHPNVLNDVNGDYPAMGSRKVMKVEKGHHRYTVFSLWDTYRNLHSLLCLVYPERQLDMVRSMVAMFKESSWLPKWELASNETHIMVGDPAVTVIAESYVKGIRNFDVQTAYKAMLHNATLGQSFNIMRPGLKDYLNYKYIPNNRNETGKNYVWGSVSTTLEYCYADWSIAQMAKALGKNKEAKIFEDRSSCYKNLFDANSGFLRPRLKDGTWFSPFNPTSIDGEQSWASSGGPGFVEGSAWQYTFMVPHDIDGLRKLMGGSQPFVNRLQKSFDKGHFVLWNEPDMAYPYLFNYIDGNAWRTQQQVNNQLTKHFNSTPSGIPGNDDCGTLSAWLVFSMMGIYPDNPVSGNYALTTPAFSEVTIKLASNKTFTIKRHGTNDQIFIEKMALDNKPYKNYFLSHKNIVKGGNFEFHTSKTANK